jgi:hypothetical protein
MQPYDFGNFAIAHAFFTQFKDGFHALSPCLGRTDLSQLKLAGE